MNANDYERQIMRVEAARVAGHAPNKVRYFAEQTDASSPLSGILRTPIVPQRSPQITDPDDANFGKFRFVMGVSRMGGEDVMG